MKPPLRAQADGPQKLILRLQFHVKKVGASFGSAKCRGFDGFRNLWKQISPVENVRDFRNDLANGLPIAEIFKVPPTPDTRRTILRNRSTSGTEPESTCRKNGNRRTNTPRRLVKITFRSNRITLNLRRSVCLATRHQGWHSGEKKRRELMRGHRGCSAVKEGERITHVTPPLR